jgi:hypothetical protein
LDAHRDFLIERINQTSHLTLHGLKDELAARGVMASHNAVWLFMRREGLSFKKRCSLLSNGDRTLHVGGSAGDRCGPPSILGDWSSSTRRGSRPTWRRCEAGAAGVSACEASHLMAIGER